MAEKKAEQDSVPAQEEAPRKLDKTIPGGKYRNASGQLVNANNEPIDENGKVLKSA